jgi:hypothetical protein
MAFPPPWTIDEANDACFIVRDKDGQALGYFYFEDEPGRRSAARLVGSSWAQVRIRAIADALLACGTLTADQIYDLVS